MNSRKFSTGKMVRLAVLTAILIVFSVTPLGFLKIGVVSITFNMIPVVVGAIILGPACGAFLGSVFGIASLLQCFGTDPFGTLLMNAYPLRTAVMCLIPRFFAGLLPGLVFMALERAKSFNSTIGGRIASVAITALCGSVTNTVLFVGALVLFFAASPEVADVFGTNDVWTIITILVTINALIEAAVCTVIGGAVGRAILHVLPEKKKSEA